MSMSRAGSNGTAALERAGAETVKRAVQLDVACRFQESLVCYQEGIDLLLQVVKGAGRALLGARAGPGDTRAGLDPRVPRGAGERGREGEPAGLPGEPGRAGLPGRRPLCSAGP